MYSLADILSEVKCKKIIHDITNKCRSTCSCGAKIAWKASTEYGWCKQCRKQIYPKASTWLSGSNLSCRQILQLVWCWQNRQSPGSVISAINLSYPTIERWYKRFRQHLPADDSIKLCGIVEVDESYFGKKRHGGQTIVIGAIERLPHPRTGQRRLKLRIIPDTEQDSLEKFLEDNVERNSLVITDCHSGYNDIEWLGYSHETWNHSRGHFSGTNHIEQNWSAMKRYMRKLYGSVPTKDLGLILNEWQARHNRPELFKAPDVFILSSVGD